MGRLERALKFKPQSNLIEKTAGELAGVWYEIGRGQGMTSKWKTPKTYARANLEQFIPVAIKHLLEILGNPSTPDLMKQEIYDALIERANDPDLKIFDLPSNPNIKGH